MNKQKIPLVYVLWQFGIVNKWLFTQGRLYCLVMLLTLLTGGALVSTASAEPGSKRVDQVKAAFILNIVRFVSWPETFIGNSSEHLSLCIYREYPLSRLLNSIHGKKAGGRTIQVSTILTLTESDFCHVLFIPNGSLNHFEVAIQPGLNRPMLTIADFTRRESSLTRQSNILVALVRKGKHIGFQVNLKKSRKMGLRMSSKLLKLATIVREGES